MGLDERRRFSMVRVGISTVAYALLLWQESSLRLSPGPRPAQPTVAAGSSRLSVWIGHLLSQAPRKAEGVTQNETTQRRHPVPAYAPFGGQQKPLLPGDFALQRRFPSNVQSSARGRHLQVRQ